MATVWRVVESVVALRARIWRSIFHDDSSQTTTQSPTSSNTTPPKPKIQSNTGGLRRLPILKKSSELLYRAQQTTARLEPPTSAKYPNALKRTHKHGAERLTTLTQQLCVPRCREGIPK
mmetsp:Transcript_52453/g.63197  ORF Transcript_52453/g.63197 Transcript_52453/m.63197 type:complete len:119 (-) Transcript_52453:1012-1368(-)